MSIAKKGVSFAKNEDGFNSITADESTKMTDDNEPPVIVDISSPPPPSKRTFPSEVTQPLTTDDDPSPSDDVETVRHPFDLECPAWIVKIQRIIERIVHLVMSEGGLVIILVIYSFIGAAAFVAIEGKFEDEQLEKSQGQMAENVSNRQRFLDAVLDLMRFGQNNSDLDIIGDLEVLLDDFQVFPGLVVAGNDTNSTMESGNSSKQWTWFGALIFCGTVYTTVGYGHIVPVTDMGRIVTMIYGIIGIPLCLVVLGKLGKSLTRLMKFFWSFVRRFYYTGSCFKVRKKAGWRKLSLGEKFRLRLARRGGRLSKKDIEGAMVPFDVDDNFNLPPIIALLIAFLYIFFGAFMYTRWENWTFLEAFYFTFTSLATIGFGDILPSHPKFFIAAGAYILVGLSLIAMVITVVMEAVSETITKAKDQVMLVGNMVKEAKEKVIKGGGPSGKPKRGSTSPQEVPPEVENELVLPVLMQHPSVRRNSM